MKANPACLLHRILKFPQKSGMPSSNVCWGLTRTMVEMVCRQFLLSPALLGRGSGRFLCRWFAVSLGLLAILGLAASLWASAAIVEVSAVAALAGLLVLTITILVLLVFPIAVPHRSGTGWTATPAVGVEGHTLNICLKMAHNFRT